MPCTDGGVPFPPTREEVLADKVPAMLCAIVGAINSDKVPVTMDRVLRHADWNEAGVTREEFEEWQKLHQRQDAERKRREQEVEEAVTTRNRALRKLTAAERKSLLRDP